MDETGAHYTECNKSEVSQKDEDHYNILTHIYGIQKDVNDNSICRTEKETQIYRKVFQTLWEVFLRVPWIKGDETFTFFFFF